jgi:tetratricopeptide (TPR) repeat protein
MSKLEFQLRPIHKDAVKGALEKAIWYRALNEPLEAESICRDVLALEPDNQEARSTLLLALTDQFGRGLQGRVHEARELALGLASEYEREYFQGIIEERRAKALHQKGTPGCGHIAYEGLRGAMSYYEKAEKIRPPGNDDALLRWNACARVIMSHRDIAPEPTTAREFVELE